MIYTPAESLAMSRSFWLYPSIMGEEYCCTVLPAPSVIEIFPVPCTFEDRIIETLAEDGFGYRESMPYPLTAAMLSHGPAHGTVADENAAPRVDRSAR